MTTINGVNFGEVLQEATNAARAAASGDWEQIKDIVDNVGKAIVNDIEHVAKQKANGTLDEYGAKIFMEDQRIVARVRLRSVAIMTAKLAEDVLNAMITVFQTAINTALGWTIF